MSKTAKSTLVGLTIGLVCIISSMLVSGHINLFWNLPSAFITIGGTTGAIVVSFPPSRLKTLGPVMMKAFKRERYDLEKDVETIVALAEISRKEGLLALEDYIEQYTEDEFLKKGILLIVDGADEDQLRTSLEGATYFMQQRHQKGYAMLDMIAAIAPSLGLLGTYIGLIPMLNSLEDPTALGPLMALELISSFYGAFVAYIIFSPLAKRLKIMSAEEVARREILIEGLAYIQQGKNPKIIADQLISYINLKQDNEGGSKKQQNKFKSEEVA